MTRVTFLLFSVFCPLVKAVLTIDTDWAGKNTMVDKIFLNGVGMTHKMGEHF